MTDHTHDLPCQGKRRYATGAKARAATTTIRRRGRSSGAGKEPKPARAYSCEACGGFHLTSSLTTDRRIR